MRTDRDIRISEYIRLAIGILSLLVVLPASSQTGSGTSIPLIGSISPAKVLAGSPSFTLTVNGSNFASDSVVQINGANRSTAFVNAGQLAVSIPSTDISASGFPNVTVVSPSSGITSNSAPLTVFRYGDINFDNTITITDLAVLANYVGGTATLLDASPADLNLDGFIDATDIDILANFLAGNIHTLPASLPPVINSLSPAKIVAGGVSLNLTVSGKYFPHDAQVQINGSSRPTTFVNTFQLTATLTSSDVSASGFPNITVLSPSTGAVSNASRLTVFRYGDINFDNTITITDLVVLANYVGGTATLLDPSPADLNLDGFIDATDIDILANFLAGNIHTLPASLPPEIDGLVPGKVVAGGPSFNLIVNGKDFAHDALVQINGSSRPTTFVNTRQLAAMISNSDIAASGFPNITLLSSSTGVSNPSRLTVFRYCDLNFDNVVSITDLVLFANFLGGRTTLVDSSPADVNLDGHIDILDYLICANYLAGNIHTLPVATGDFSLSASPSSLTITAGDAASYIISATGMNGSTSNVDLAFDGLPVDNATLNPAAIVGNGTATLTLPTSATIPPGAYTITITGTSGSFTHSVIVALTVLAPLPPDSCGGDPGGDFKGTLQPCLID